MDERLGTHESLKDVVKALHDNGIRVILDGVFNHVGREFWAFEDVKRNGRDSKYCSWFQNLNFGGNSPMGDPFWYEAWEGHYDLVKLNLNHPEVTEHLLGAVSMWMDEFKIDGLRLDVANCLTLEFIRTLNQFTKSKKPDFWLMGELIHGDYSRFARPGMLDSATNYECYKGIYSSHNTKNYFEIAYSLNRQFGSGGIYRDVCTYNFVDNHDVTRLASILISPQDIDNVYTLLFTMPGVPSIYYGSEWGIRGKKEQGSDWILRPSLTLGPDSGKDDRVYRHIKNLSKIRKELVPLQTGRYEQIIVKNQQFVFCRSEGEQTVYIALNLSDQSETLSFPVKDGIYYDYLHYPEEVAAQGGQLQVTVASKGASILTNKIENTVRSKQDFCIELLPTDVSAPDDPVLRLGRYRDAEGDEYRVLGVAKNSQTKEEFVVYQQISKDQELFVRPLKQFLDLSRENGKERKGFSYLGE